MDDDVFIELMKAEQLDRIEREQASKNGGKNKSDNTDKEDPQKFPWIKLLFFITFMIIAFIKGLKSTHDILDVILLIPFTGVVGYWLFTFLFEDE